MIELRADALRRVELVGPDAADVGAAIVEWFTSPYWPDQRAIPNCFTSNPPLGETSPPAAIATVADSQLSTFIGATRPHGAVEPARWSLVDQYVSSPGSALTPERVEALDRACQPESDTYALLHLDNHHLVRSSVASLLALVIAETVRTSVRYPVYHGINSILGVVERQPRTTSRRATLAPVGTHIAGFECLLPTSAGRAARTQIVAQAVTAVPVVLYPLVAAVIAEASGNLVPLIKAPPLFGATTATAIVPASRPQVAAWRLQRVVASPMSAIARTTLSTTATTLAMARKLADSRPATHALRRFGIDTTRSSGVVTRLRSSPEANPWMTTKAERAALRAPACNPIATRPGTP